ncbi:hypothetical protein [Pseudothauera rhizosphaerae]|uniref:Uncharacterized protein n=1 Tax=Pseudothauera rhizosphaerae TaxID=2565932 RepID=A0A4S4AMU3_9RHOO|nr:hypothetical protein [Pseudothauera rhizosphaerae]THF60931.1 hypothetical protein E6O51_11930 [Pseudothauera rhizosphaerae]
MPERFIRERRYIVLKLSDIRRYLNDDAIRRLENIEQRVQREQCEHRWLLCPEADTGYWCLHCGASRGDIPEES